MAIRTKDELITDLEAAIGDSVSDETLALMENVVDTINDYERRLGDGQDWEARFKENDEAWRQRFKARFLRGDAAIIERETDYLDEENDRKDPAEVEIKDILKREDEA